MPHLDSANILEFQEKGYTIVKKALTEKQVSLLHEEADTLTNYLISEGFDLAQDLGCVVEPWSCGFLDQPVTDEYKTDPTVYSKIRNTFILDYDRKSDSISQLILRKYGAWAKQLLSSEKVYLLNEQYIIKPPNTQRSSQFQWHKDSDYYTENRHTEQDTIACWTALDSVNLCNGTVQVLDYSGEQNVLEAPAGSILFMSSRILHRSTGNATRTFRRAFMPQYSSIPLLDSLSLPLAFAIDCDGK